MPTTSAQMTVEQYSALPDPKGGRYELHHGVLVEVSFPDYDHWDIEQAFLDRLRPLAQGRGRVGTEFAFRPLREYEVWSADIVFVAQARINTIKHRDWLHGAPELVIEVLSPSNTVAEMNEKKAICLENGCREFWVVDPKRKTIEVSTPDRKTITYVAGERVPLTLPAPGELAVSDIFPG